jgi:hypothetical protein
MQATAFWRELFKTTKPSRPGQAQFLWESRPIAQSRCAKFQRSPSAKGARATRARGRSTPGSCNGLFSPGNSLQGFRRGLKTSLNQPNERSSIHFSFPLPSDRALAPIGADLQILPKATRRLYCFSNNLLRVAQGQRGCKSQRLGRSSWSVNPRCFCASFHQQSL